MASIVCLPSVKLKFNSVSKLTYKPVYTLALAFSEVVASMIVETVPPEWPVKFVLLDGGLQWLEEDIVVVDVVDLEENLGKHLVDADQVVDVGPGKGAAGVAIAWFKVWFNSPVLSLLLFVQKRISLTSSSSL